MPKQHRYEGSSLGPLLERVRDELGSTARIIEANRLRKGGMGGFFSRETYEVIAETDELVDAGDASVSEVAAVAPVPVAPSTATVPQGGSTDRSSVSLSAQARSLLELADEITSETAARSRPTVETTAPPVPAAALTPPRPTRADRDDEDDPFVPTMSTESSNFAEILDRIAADVDAGSEIVIPAARVATPAALPTAAATIRDSTRVVAPTASNPPAARTRTAASQPPAARTMTAATIAPPARTPAPTRAAVPTAPTPESTRSTAATSGTPVTTRATAAVVTRRLSDERDREIEPYVRIGLPVHLVPMNVGERDIRLALADRLRTLPIAPAFPTTRGALLAVVGNAESALRIARDLADELGVSADDVAFASEFATDEVPAWLHLSDASTAAERRRSWRRRGQLTLVALDAPMGGLSSPWARDVLDALEPSLAWGVVDAVRKPEDVLAWTEHLGGLDSYALEGLEQTVSPAAILKLPIPVARLDGEPATPDRWAAILAGRLVA